MPPIPIDQLSPYGASDYLSSRWVAFRYGVSIRTVDRWKERKVIPPPDLVVNKRNYWNRATLNSHDLARTREAAACGRPIPQLEQEQS